jgi:hypothetical protein
MTETHSNSLPALDTDACEAKAHEQARLSESIHAGNKAALFDALARTGITIVTVSFDGYGDSGQIEEIQAKARRCACRATCRRNRASPDGPWERRG